MEAQDQSVSGIAYEDKTFFNRAFTVLNNVTWNGTRNALLGCFFVKRMDGLNFTVPAGGWSMGFTYSDTDQDRKAISATRLCRSFTSSSSSKATCPAGSMIVAKPVLHVAQKGRKDDDDYKSFKPVCTHVDVQRIDNRKFQVCLSTFTSPLVPVCKKRTINATLAGIFFHSAGFGVPEADYLTIENGTIQFATPICSSANSNKKQGRVERCGPSIDDLRLHSTTKLRLDVGLSVVKTNPWPTAAAANGSFELGCFYVTGPETFNAAAVSGGWGFGLRYNDVLKAGKPEKFGKVPLIERIQAGIGAMTLPFQKAKKKTYSVMIGKLCYKSRKGF